MSNSKTLKESEMCESCFDEEQTRHLPNRIEADIDLLDDYAVRISRTKGSIVITIDQVDPVVRLIFSDIGDLNEFLDRLQSKAIGQDTGGVYV